jgi:hypothetical protein
VSKLNIARGCAGAAAIALALTACGGSSGSHGATPTTAGTGAAAILSFVVPATVKCGPGPNANVPVSYAVDSARGQRVVIDGQLQRGTEATRRTIVFPIPCDNRKHTVALLVEGARGHLVGRTAHVTTLRRKTATEP